MNNFFWAIGLFEGEGCIYVANEYKGGRVQIRMTDLDVCKRFASIMGWPEPYKVKVPGKPQYHTQLATKSKVVEWLQKVLPYLGDRRACKALDLLDRIDDCYQ